MKGQNQGSLCNSVTHRHLGQTQLIHSVDNATLKITCHVRWLSGEGVGLVFRRLPDRFPALPNNVVSLGKALHLTCLGGNVPVLIVSRSG